VFFMATDGIDYGLWTSDGSVAGTHRLTPIPGTPAGYTLTGSGPLFYFTDTDVTQLWRSDGTEAGTFVIQTAELVTSLTDVDGRLFFVADDGVHGSELWTTNGIAEGPLLVADLNPGATGSAPAAPASVDGRLLFAADDGVHGKELWRSDGTARGPRWSDLAPGRTRPRPPASRSPAIAFFTADDGVSGTELWAVPAAALVGNQRRRRRPKRPSRDSPCPPRD
jgi:ELWxxDGT repeat protein